MPEQIPPDSVGLVEPQLAIFDNPLKLACGQTLPHYELAYETYGNLNSNKSNAVLICHALSGHHHAAGFHSMEDRKPGWWDNYIGPGKPIDTNHFFVVALNNLGGCHGSTGPNSINPATKKLYGPEFPIVTVKDWVNSQARLADMLGIEQWAAIIGGSLGGMQALQWSIDYPDRLKYAVIIASAPKLTAQNIAFNEVARQAIMSDEGFHNGWYKKQNDYPKKGLMLARMVGHITYLSDDAMRQKFGRELRSGAINFDFGAEFQVESYLRYQGEVFSENFDANTYLLMTKALDYFDPAKDYNDDLVAALSHASCQFFIMSFTTDWRFSPERSKETVDALLSAKKNVSYLDIDAPEGHDAFLLPIPRYRNAFKAYLARIANEVKANEN
ncbi:homoserine O-succinyltransferase MetX [Spartinivicinus poritis]|uniref:Homoserine O-succinyltransferase n=1 Tax=Spartinivicinus poritis TaxID=2994640 RepID=A0ABT5UCY0_9GAMM|nr:homoserine O-acetyltransferase [Spartinivicinus sp. A2-2]MDE1463303.1 homoserine O-acetyltransferase [Spartinivicinus sp. A2-2]